LRIRLALERYSATLIFVAIYLKDVLAAIVPATTFWVLLGFGILTSLLLPRRTFSRLEQVVLLSSLFLFVLLSAKNQAFVFSAYLIGPIVFFALSDSGRRAFAYLLLFHLFTSTLIQVGESLSSHYFFSILSDVGIELDESFFAGDRGIFRAKGLFQGPLSAAGFALLVAFLFPRRIGILALAFISAYLASARFSMFATFLMIASLLFNKARATGRATLSLLLFASLAFVYFSGVFADSFFFDAFRVQSANNSARIHYWGAALDRITSYDLQSILLGDYSASLSARGYIESDFLRLIADLGIIGFSCYLFALLYLMWMPFRRSAYLSLTSCCILIAAMTLTPLLQSLGPAVVFWAFFHDVHSRKIEHKES
jgi:hypothetical protein